MHAGDRLVEGQGDVVRRCLTDREHVALQRDPVPRASDPHLEVVVAPGPRATVSRISSDVTHG